MPREGLKSVQNLNGDEVKEGAVVSNFHTHGVSVPVKVWSGYLAVNTNK